ncbi:50S ribosomal protein L24 [Candidatus Parcubacteria bacterium]|nr:50S ribosomal protein L24 [Candidatus Parcubacteria bacterium]MBI4098972.1 50S ribosomal protein L24 [Candidatus Parcubacteria bacterium]MBI4385333.1 50S ribosomal protein L24 [Candidatus Parcubacteria bacterium]
MRLRKGDTVVMLSGKDRGKRGKVLRVLPRAGRLVVEGINIRVRHRRPRKGGEKGQKIEFPASLSAAKAMVVCPTCSKPTRIKAVMAGARKSRGCMRCGATF